MEFLLKIGEFVDFPNHRVEITEILSHIFWQKVRENNGFTKEVTK